MKKLLVKVTLWGLTRGSIYIYIINLCDLNKKIKYNKYDNIKIKEYILTYTLWVLEVRLEISKASFKPRNICHNTRVLSTDSIV